MPLSKPFHFLKLDFFFIVIFFLSECPIALHNPVCSMLLNSIFISNRTVSGNLEAQDRFFVTLSFLREC